MDEIVTYFFLETSGDLNNVSNINLKSELCKRSEVGPQVTVEFCLCCRLADEMNMPSLPEMLFGDNVLRIQHSDGYGIEFNAIDALRRVNNMEDVVKVACAQEWQESRWDDQLCLNRVLTHSYDHSCLSFTRHKQQWVSQSKRLIRKCGFLWCLFRADSEHSKEVVRPYDWTYTTDYRGTLIGEGLQMQVSHLNQYNESCFIPFIWKLYTFCSECETQECLGCPSPWLTYN